MSHSQELPPAVQLWLDETSRHADDPERVYRLLADEALLRDLRDQAEQGSKSFPYADREPLSAGLSLFAADSSAPVFTATCMAPACRTREAQHFAETAALYADQIILVDEMTAFFARGSDISAKLPDVAVTTHILHMLRPLFDSGILKFARPQHHFCSACASSRGDQISDVAERLVDELKRGLSIKVTRSRSGETVALVSSPLFDSNSGPRASMLPLPRGTQRIKPPMKDLLARTLVRSRVEKVYFATEAAIRSGATLAINDRFTAATLRLLDGKLQGTTAPKWDAERRVHLPVFEGLSPAELLIVRQEAGDALSRFRQLMTATVTDATDPDDASKTLARQLQDEARVVEVELRAVDVAAVRRSGVFLTSGGLALTLFGLATVPQAAATGMAALIAAAAHSMKEERNARAEEVRIKAKPGYLSLVAERLKRKHKH